MNIVIGKDFDLLKRGALLLEAVNLQISPRQNKKYVVTLPNDKKFTSDILIMKIREFKPIATAGSHTAAGSKFPPK